MNERKIDDGRMESDDGVKEKPAQKRIVIEREISKGGNG
jgi:hypothetical protein